MINLLIIPEFFGISLEVYFIVLILGISSYYFWNFVLKRRIENEKTRKTSIWIATILTAPLLYLSLVLILVTSVSYYPSNNFDKKAWDKDIEKRYELSEDIIESEFLLGKTKTEVKNILGQDFQETGASRWSYYLGFRPQLFGIDPDFLDIDFKNEKVIKVSQHTS